jgi:hypothetical protein
MILPTKHVRADRALVGIGAELLSVLRRPMTVSALWDAFRRRRGALPGMAPITYDWFVLALDLLYVVGAVSLDAGVLRRTRATTQAQA